MVFYACILFLKVQTFYQNMKNVPMAPSLPYSICHKSCIFRCVVCLRSAGIAAFLMRARSSFCMRQSAIRWALHNHRSLHCLISGYWKTITRQGISVGHFTLGPVLFRILANRTRRVDLASGLHSHYKRLTRRERYAPPTSPCVHTASASRPVVTQLHVLNS